MWFNSLYALFSSPMAVTSAANTVNKSARNNMIQVFRAIAIILVVFGHTCPPGHYLYLCRPFINCSVAIFLYLSGYLTRADNNDWLGLFKRRISRVGIPYVLWTVLCSLADRTHEMWFNLLTASAASPYYFVFVYIQFVLLTPLMVRLARSRYQWVGWLVSPVSVIIFSYLKVYGIVHYHPNVSLLWWDSSLGFFTYYYLGLILGNRIKVINYPLRTLTILFAVSIVIQMIEGRGWYLLGEPDCGSLHKLSTLLTSSLCVLIVHTMLEQGFNVKSKALRLVGDLSFGIYMSHILVMLGLLLIPLYYSMPFGVNTVILLLVTLAVCWLTRRVCGEKVSHWLGIV